MKRLLQKHTTYIPRYNKTDLANDISESIEYRNNVIKIKLLTIPSIFNILVDKRKRLVDRNKLIECRMWKRYNKYANEFIDLNFMMLVMRILGTVDVAEAMDYIAVNLQEI